MEEAFKIYCKQNGLPTHKDTRGLFMAPSTRKAHRAFKAGYLAAHNAQRTTHNAQRTTNALGFTLKNVRQITPHTTTRNP